MAYLHRPATRFLARTDSRFYLQDLFMSWNGQDRYREVNKRSPAFGVRQGSKTYEVITNDLYGTDDREDPSWRLRAVTGLRRLKATHTSVKRRRDVVQGAINALQSKDTLAAAYWSKYLVVAIPWNGTSEATDFCQGYLVDNFLDLDEEEQEILAADNPELRNQLPHYRRHRVVTPSTRERIGL